MNNETLKEELMRGARQGGICIDGYEAMRTAGDREALVDYYTENPDWCMERGFPDLKTLTEKFSDCENKGVFVNRVFKGERLDERQTYIFHNCRGEIRTGLNVDKAIIPMLYMANGCRMKVVGAGEVKMDNPPVVPVYVFGANDVKTRSNGYAKFKIYKNALI